MGDGFEYQSAIDLNNGVGSLPYPGKRPYPNPLNGDANTDYDGDGLTAAQEHALWRYVGPNALPLSYSAGLKRTAGPVDDDLRDGDADGLGNWDEFNGPMVPDVVGEGVPGRAAVRPDVLGSERRSTPTATATASSTAPTTRTSTAGRTSPSSSAARTASSRSTPACPTTTRGPARPTSRSRIPGRRSARDRCRRSRRLAVAAAGAELCSRRDGVVQLPQHMVRGSADPARVGRAVGAGGLPGVVEGRAHRRR